MKGTPHEPYPPDTRSNDCCRGGCQKKRLFRSVLDPPLFSHCLRSQMFGCVTGLERERVTEHEKPGGGGGGGQRVDPSGSGATSSESSGLCRRFVPRVPTDRFTTQPGRHWSTQHVHCCSALLSCLCCSVRCPTVTPRWPSVLTFISPLRTTQTNHRYSITPWWRGSCREERQNLL